MSNGKIIDIVKEMISRYQIDNHHSEITMTRLVSLAASIMILIIMSATACTTPAPANPLMTAKQAAVDLQTEKVRIQTEKMTDAEIAKGIVYEPTPN